MHQSFHRTGLRVFKMTCTRPEDTLLRETSTRWPAVTAACAELPFTLHASPICGSDILLHYASVFAELASVCQDKRYSEHQTRQFLLLVSTSISAKASWLDALDSLYVQVATAEKQALLFHCQ